MAKKRQQNPPETERNPVSASSDTGTSQPGPGQPSAPEAERRGFNLSVRQYILLNVIFDAFLVFQLLLVRVFIQQTRGLYFFFALLMLGFLVVSVFDYLYDRFARK